jgi:hypothetical protein
MEYQDYKKENAREIIAEEDSVVVITENGEEKREYSLK